MDRLLIFLILTGLFPLGVSVTHKYYLIQQGETWSKAQAYCRAHYTDLATITSETDMSDIQIAFQNLYSSAWIGLWNDINSWHWSNGNEALGTMRPWAVAEPNNNLGCQECGGIRPDGWVDINCRVPFPFVCFDDKKTGTDQYVVYTVIKTWTDAQTFCRQYHTDLASARNAIEHSIIKGKISGQTIFGLFRDSWKWSGQSSVSNISWAPGEPNNAGGSDNCAYLNNSQVYDGPCSDIKPFFCYQVAVQKQIVRFNILSDQDVKNSTVMAALMEKIQQKLKEHKMENVTVNWREQADGTVFKKPKTLV